MKTRKITYTLPEIVDGKGRPFTVKEHVQACVKLQAPCSFQVPLGAEPYQASVRAHELAHIRFTPTDKPPGDYAKAANVPDAYLQAAEDCRVNTLARELGVSMNYLSEPTGLPQSLANMLASAPIDYLACFALARSGCRSESRLIDKAFQTDRKGRAALAIAARAYPYASCAPTIDGSIAAAKLMASIFGAAADLDAKMPPGSGLPSCDLSDPETLAAVTTYAGHYAKPRSTCWGPMRIATPPRVTPCNVIVRSLRPRAMDSGLLPTHIHRLPIDGLIFRLKARARHGGSVLFDLSGSMSLPFARVADWLRGSPFATVAAYSSDIESGDDECMKGVLTILAKDGLRTDGNAHKGGDGNVIDGPALRWLARQPAPRYWVSDGGTTGQHDIAFGAAECRALCRIHRITQVPRFATWLEVCPKA